MCYRLSKLTPPLGQKIKHDLIWDSDLGPPRAPGSPCDPSVLQGLQQSCLGRRELVRNHDKWQ